VLEARRGLVIVAGQLAAGKSTTLYSAASTANAPGVSVMTIEDPIRQLVPGLSQVQAKDDIGLSTANAIRAFVRQEADVIMVGELIDADAAQASAHVALEGRLVLAGLFAADAAAAIVRLIDMGMEPSMLASALKVVVAQRMLRRVCESCRTQEEMPGGDLHAFGASVAAARRYKISRAVGCDACHGTGYKGRIGAFEMIAMTDELHRLMVNRAPVADFRAAIRRAGTESLRKAALKLALSGLTTLEEVVRLTDADDGQRDRQ
jgi:type IV pilus assembly protein PilB